MTIREGVTLEEAIAEARQNDSRRKAGGYDQAALDVAGRDGFSNGEFEDSEEETSEIVDEFFCASGESSQGIGGSDDTFIGLAKTKLSLTEKLNQKVACIAGSSK